MAKPKEIRPAVQESLQRVTELLRRHRQNLLEPDARPHPQQVDDYEDLTVRPATDRAYRDSVRSKVAYDWRRQPLFGTRRFTRNLERAYAPAREHRLAGKSAQIFKIEEDLA